MTFSALSPNIYFQTMPEALMQTPPSREVKRFQKDDLEAKIKAAEALLASQGEEIPVISAIEEELQEGGDELTVEDLPPHIKEVYDEQIVKWGQSKADRGVVLDAVAENLAIDATKRFLEQQGMELPQEAEQRLVSKLKARTTGLTKKLFHLYDTTIGVEMKKEAAQESENKEFGAELDVLLENAEALFQRFGLMVGGIEQRAKQPIDQKNAQQIFQASGYSPQDAGTMAVLYRLYQVGNADDFLRGVETVYPESHDRVEEIRLERNGTPKEKHDMYLGHLYGDVDKALRNFNFVDAKVKDRLDTVETMRETIKNEQENFGESVLTSVRSEEVQNVSDYFDAELQLRMINRLLSRLKAARDKLATQVADAERPEFSQSLRLSMKDILGASFSKSEPEDFHRGIDQLEQMVTELEKKAREVESRRNVLAGQKQMDLGKQKR